MWSGAGPRGLALGGATRVYVSAYHCAISSAAGRRRGRHHRVREALPRVLGFDPAVIERGVGIENSLVHPPQLLAWLDTQLLNKHTACFLEQV
jgi:hypothetical protein